MFCNCWPWNFVCSVFLTTCGQILSFLDVFYVLQAEWRMVWLSVVIVLVKRFKVLSVKSQSVDLCSTLPANLPNALGAIIPCKQKCIKQAPESIFGEVRIADWVRKTVPGGRTSNGKSPAAVRAECSSMSNVTIVCLVGGRERRLTASAWVYWRWHRLALGWNSCLWETGAYFVYKLSVISSVLVQTARFRFCLHFIVLLFFSVWPLTK